MKYPKIKKILIDLNPDYIYLNGLYSLQFFIYPILIIKSNILKSTLIICPRGMLQRGALQVKSHKKSIYLKFLKWSNVLNNANWHATNKEEQTDINKYFPINNKNIIAYNIPKPPLEYPISLTKIKGKLKLVYLSLITEKKNLHLLIEVLEKTKPSITLSIYGPIKDKKYWESKCLSGIVNLKNRVTYFGDVEPVKVQNIIGESEIFILLTQGENFGHALYESLSVGRPLFTSYFTPWNNLMINKAGWNADINNMNSIINQLNEIVEMETDEFNIFCNGAHTLAKDYYNQSFIESYLKLFS